MDFESMKRRQLQSLCKKNNIPANLTNAAMAHSLSVLPFVVGLEEFLRDPTAGDLGSPDGSAMIASTRRRITREDTEVSKLGTRTRCETRRRAVNGTPATQNKTSLEPTNQKRGLKGLQADFEADMHQSQLSDITDSPGEIEEDVSEVKMDNKEELSLESQNESENQQLLNVVQEILDLDINKENVENNGAVSEGQEGDSADLFKSTRKVDFHSLSRRDLQSLCKKNKIPANTTNATMADALDSLEIVEGLEEFLMESNSEAPQSPTISEMTSSCARRTWTSHRIPKEPTSSKLVTTSCRGSRRKITQDIDEEKSASNETQEVVTTASSTDIVSDEVSAAAELTQAPVSDKIIESDDESVVRENEKGNSGSPDTENVIQLEDSEINEAADDVDHFSNVGGSQVPDQQQCLVNTFNESEVLRDDKGFKSESEDNHPENGNESMCNEDSGDSELSNGFENDELHVDEGNNNECLDSAVDLKDLEVFSDDMDFRSESEENHHESGNDSEGNELSNDAGFEDGSETENASETENDEIHVDEGNNSECLVSAVFSDAGPVDLCLEEKLDEGAQEEYQVSEKFDEDFTTLPDQPAALVNNAETNFEVATTNSDFEAELCHVEQIESFYGEEGNTSTENFEANYAENEKSKEADSESIIQIDTYGANGGKTPLDNKSMRQLKKMLKEKLQATILAKKMGTLTLEEKDDQLAKVEEDVDEEYEDPEGASDAGKELEDVIEMNDVLGAGFVGSAVELHTVDKLMDNLITEDSATGSINVEIMGEEGHMSITPVKSIGRVAGVSEVNKENIDHSANRTEATKLSGARVVSAMSMGKLKKALEQSEKKRPALHVRSENCQPLI